MAAVGVIAGIAGMAGVLAGILSDYGKMRQGKMNAYVFAGRTAMNVTLLGVPSAGAIGRIAAQTQPYTSRQALLLIGHIARTFLGITGLGSWPWR